jgi:hypothetical protein
MTEPATPVLELWDRVIALAEQAAPTDWTRPTPDPDMTVGDVVTHVAAGAPLLGRSPAELLDGLRLAREAYASRVTLAEPGHHVRDDRALGASCLDLYVHAHDVATALRIPVDLDDDSPAVAAACRYLMHLAPKLMTARVGAQEGDAVRLALPGVGDGLATAGPRLWRPDSEDADADPDDGTVVAKPAAFVLLLAGRGDPGHYRARGALDWSGASGEAFVRKARLFTP